MKKKMLLIIYFCIFMFPFSVFAGERKEVTLNKCVDGDTAYFNVGNEKKKARFLAIDTPESVHPTKGVEPYGKEASSYTCSKLTNASKIEIEYDDGSNKEDKYGRILVWVYTDSNLLQKDLVSKGYAKVAYLYGDYQYTSILQAEEKKAKEKKLRIWSDEATTSSDGSTTNAKSSAKKSTKSKKNDIFDEILAKITRKLVKTLENML